MCKCENQFVYQVFSKSLSMIAASMFRCYSRKSAIIGAGELFASRWLLGTGSGVDVTACGYAELGIACEIG